MTTQQLPTPGGDAGTWGDMLNGFLQVAHNVNGSLQTTALSDAGAELVAYKGQTNGYASLDSTANVPVSQLGNAPVVSINGQTGTVALSAANVQALALSGGTMTGPVSGLQDKGSQLYNVKAYGATGNGSTDDTTAIQDAITAAQTAGGGVVFFPTGTYIVSASLSIGGGSPGALTIQGAGWDSQVKLANGANCYLFDMGSGGNPVFTPGIVVRDLYVQCNGANQTALSGGIYARGSVFGLFEHVWVDSPYDAGVRFYEDGLGNYGHHNRFVGCLFTNGYVSMSYGFAIRFDHCDENSVIGCTFQDNGTSVYPSCQVYDTNAGLQTIEASSFVTTQTTSVTMFKTDSSPSRCTIMSNQFDSSTSGNLLEINGDQCAVIGNSFLNFGAGSGTNAAIHLPNSYTRVVGNVFTALGTNGQALYEDSGNYNVITNNNAVGTYYGNAPIVTAGAQTIVRSNVGYNPHAVTTPSFPISSSTYTNGTGVDVVAYITNGTAAMTTQINGNTGPNIAASATATVFIPAGSSFKPVYANGSPTWIFQGN